MFLHNVRELMEKMSEGEEGSSLAELMELSLLNQSKISLGVILNQNDLKSELAINLGIGMDVRMTTTPDPWIYHLKIHLSISNTS